MSGEPRPERDAAAHSDARTLELLSEALSAEPAGVDARARLSAALRGPLRYAPHAPRVAVAFGVSEPDARLVLGAASSGQGFQPELWPGAEVLRHPVLERVGCVIARIPAGLAIPEHSHGLRELTYVLDGELHEDRAGAPLQHGDGSLLDMAPGTRHALRVAEGTACLVLFAIRAR